MHLLAPGFRTTIGIFDLLETSPTPSPKPIPVPGVAKKPVVHQNKLMLEPLTQKTRIGPATGAAFCYPKPVKPAVELICNEMMKSSIHGVHQLAI